MGVREQLNLQFLIFVISGAVVGTTIALAKLTDEAVDIRPEVKWYAVGVGVFALLVHLYSWSTFAVRVVATACGRGESSKKHPVSPVLRMCLLAALCVLGSAILWPLTTIAGRNDELARFPYQYPDESDDLPYDILKRIFDEPAGDEAWRRKRVGHVLEPFASVTVVRTRITGLAFSSLVLAWALVGLMFLELIMIPTIKRKEGGGWTIVVTDTETGAIALPADDDADEAVDEAVDEVVG